MEQQQNKCVNKLMYGCIFTVALQLISVSTVKAFSESLRTGVAQTVIEPTLQKNLEKMCSIIDQASSAGCQVLIFPEGALYWADIATHKPAKAQLDEAIAQIGQKADSLDMYVIFGAGYRENDKETYNNIGIVYNPDGQRVFLYRKNVDVPGSFNVDGIPFNLVICSDRGYLEHSDLPCLVQGSRVIIDISGGHGGDDGRPDMRWIRYRPWALRTGAFVIVSNPVHDDVDFMGHTPWGGGSAIIRPDGSIQAGRTYEKDVLIVEDIDISLSDIKGADRRRNHPLFKSFWDMGEKLLNRESPGKVPQIKPMSSAQRNIKIAAAQIVCTDDISRNVEKIISCIRKAGSQTVDVVVFPELAITGSNPDNITTVTQSTLDDSLERICKEADACNVYVIVGMPYFIDGHRHNCAFAIGDDGIIRTRYAQVAQSHDNLFEMGKDIKAMWFELKGVYSIVTIGDDAGMPEISDLAASLGMNLHFHITSENYSSDDQAKLGKERNLLMLMYCRYGAVVNAAVASDSSAPAGMLGGMSMIVSREGGHNKPAPDGIEYYLPYQISVVESAGTGEKMITAVRRTSSTNDLDLNRNWRNRNRKSRPQTGWYEWFSEGARLIKPGND